MSQSVTPTATQVPAAQALAAELARVSAPLARPDLVQGAGGNTSVKNGELLVVKGSGYELRQLSPTEGWALVQHPTLVQWFQQPYELTSAVAAEAAFGDVVKAHTLQLDAANPRRPSMETGFHAILPAVVLHTHSVLANLVTCRTDGEVLLQEIFGDLQPAVVWIPYIHPGYWLTLSISQAQQKALAENGQEPEVYFLQNHGLIVTATTAERALAVQQQVTDRLRQHFGLTEDYPYQNPVEEPGSNGSRFISANPWLREALLSLGASSETLETQVLFPDQSIYFHLHTGAPGSGRRLELDPASGQVTYNGTYKEARTLEETLTAWAWVTTQITQHGGTPGHLTAEHLGFLHNMESEKFRKAMLK